MIQGALARLARMGGKELALELLDRFLEEAPQRLEACQKALATGDGKALETHFHRISSDAGWLGDGALQGLASNLELAASEGRLADIQLDVLGGMCYELAQQLARERIILLESAHP